MSKKQIDLMSLQGKRIAIAGGSGFLGLSMSAAFEGGGASVTIISRSEPVLSASSQTGFARWDGRTLGDWIEVIDGCDADINLAGRTVDCIKTPDHCDQILRSRVETTRVLGKAMLEVENPPPVWIQMSTAHIYGDPPSARCTEASATGYGLAPTVGKAWEQAFQESKLPEQRGVLMRTSFVIGRDRGAGGGALGKLGFIAKLGLGGKVGKGTQGMSWIHEEDINRIFMQAVVDDEMSGIYIVSSPNPRSQVEFMRTLRKVLRVPIGLPAFSWMIRLGAPLIMRTDPDLVLYGRYVLPERLVEEGFEFSFPHLELALRDLYSQ